MQPYLTSEPAAPRWRTPPSFVFGGLVLVVVIGLRRDVGADWTNYERIFDAIRTWGAMRSLASADPAYAFTNWAAARLGLDIWAVNLVCAGIFTYGLLRFCRDQPNPPLAVLVAVPYLVIVVAMGFTRQGAALGLVMLALTHYFRGSVGRMTLCLAFAVAFHKSAIIVIPLLALASSRRRVLTLFLLGIIAAVAYWLFVSASLDFLVTSYMGTRYSSAGAEVRIAMNVVPAAIYFLASRWVVGTRDEKRLWWIFSIAAFVSLVLLYSTPSSAAVDRMALYLIPLQVVVFSRLPMAFSEEAKPNFAILIGVIAYSMAVEFTWLNYGVYASDWIPYDNYLFGSDQ